MRIVVITGSFDSIGAEMAPQLASSHGAQLALAARDQTRLAQVASQCAAFGALTLLLTTNHTAYSAAKFAMTGFFEMLRATRL
jgi:short-subunit dehydrogenase